jgi:hypothetical protein
MALYQHLAWLLELHGCRVFEDLSAICVWGTVGVPW